MAKQDKEKKERLGLFKQITSSYKMVRELKRSFPYILLLTFALSVGSTFAFTWFVLNVSGWMWILWGILIFLVSVTITLTIFGKIAERTAYKRIEGQPGAGVSVLQILKRGWYLTPAVSANRNQDMVSRLVGKCGVILVAEGNRNRVKHLVLAEKRRYTKSVQDISIHEVYVGNDQDEIPITKLIKHVKKLKKTLSASQAREVNARLTAIAASLAMPKGPIPRGAKIPKGARRPK